MKKLKQRIAAAKRLLASAKHGTPEWEAAFEELCAAQFALGELELAAWLRKRRANQ